MNTEFLVFWSTVILPSDSRPLYVPRSHGFVLHAILHDWNAPQPEKETLAPLPVLLLLATTVIIS